MSHSVQVQAPPLGILTSRWREQIFKAGALCVLVAWLYIPIISRLAERCWSDPNCSHAFLVPPGFVLYRERSRLCGFAPLPSAWGLPLLDLALGVLVVGVLGAELFLSRLSLLLVVAGQVSYLLGGGDFHSFLLSLAALSLLHLAPGVVRRAWEARRECAFIQDFLRCRHAG